jgi:hypothetical protein
MSSSVPAAPSAADTAATASGSTATTTAATAVFGDALSALKSLDIDGNGLSTGDLAKFKFDKEATSAAGDSVALENLNFIGQIVGTVHPQSYDLEAAAAFIAQHDQDGDGVLSDAEMGSAIPASANSHRGVMDGMGPFSLADLDTDGSGIVESDEMEAFVAFTSEVQAAADESGEIVLNASGTPSSVTTPSSTTATGAGSTTTADTDASSASDAASSSSSSSSSTAINITDPTVIEFLTRYDTDADKKLTQPELQQAQTMSQTVLQALQNSETDGTPGLTADEIKNSPNAQQLSMVLDAGVTEISADDYQALAELLTMELEALQAVEIDSTGFIDLSGAETGAMDTGIDTSADTTDTGTTPPETGVTDTETGTPGDTSADAIDTGTTPPGTGATDSAAAGSNSAGSDTSIETFLSMADRDESGSIETQEYEPIVTSAQSILDALLPYYESGKMTIPAEELSKVTDEFVLKTDLNGDGEITEDEMTAVLETNITMLSALQAADADGNGEVTPEEMEAIIAQTSSAPTGSGSAASGSDTSTRAGDSSSSSSEMNTPVPPATSTPPVTTTPDSSTSVPA